MLGGSPQPGWRNRSGTSQRTLKRYRGRMASEQLPADGRADAITAAGPHVPGSGPARLAAALGWGRVPELTPEQQREADEKLAAAQAEARRVYGLGQDAA